MQSRPTDWLTTNNTSLLLLLFPPVSPFSLVRMFFSSLQLHEIRSGTHFAWESFWHKTQLLPALRLLAGVWRRKTNFLHTVIVKETGQFRFDLKNVTNPQQSSLIFRCFQSSSDLKTMIVIIVTVLHDLFLSAADENKVEVSHVVNFILPESQTHLLHQAGYILAFFLLLLLMLIGIIMTTRHCKKKGSIVIHTMVDQIYCSFICPQKIESCLQGWV